MPLKDFEILNQIGKPLVTVPSLLASGDGSYSTVYKVRRLADN